MEQLQIQTMLRNTTKTWGRNNSEWCIRRIFVCN